MRKPALSDLPLVLAVLAVVLPVVVFAWHRWAVVLSAGDFLYPLEPSEAKNTQLAWDLMTGRFGTGDFDLAAYVANTGHLHHASYTSMAASFWLSSKVLGWGMTAVRAVPWAFSVLGMGVWLAVIARRLGPLAAFAAGTTLLFVPTSLIAFQLTFLGCHAESVLPLALAIGAWSWWLAGGGRSPLASALLGLSFGYAAIFSYLLWPLLALMGALSLLPPLPRPGWKQLVLLASGFVVGLWPLWLIVSLSSWSVLLDHPITEDTGTTLVNTARGYSPQGATLRHTFEYNLHFSQFMRWARGPGPWGLDPELQAHSLEWLRWFGPLAVLPVALATRDASARRLGALVALAPPLGYLFLVWATPWKPAIPTRYFTPTSLLAYAAPGVLLGLSWMAAREPGWRRWAVGWTSALAVGWGVFVGVPRVIEAGELLRPDRTVLNRQHRYVEYYNAGFSNVWAQQVPHANDFLDVRAAQAAELGSSDPYDGVMAGFWGSGRRMALPYGDWSPPEIRWGDVRSGIDEWAESDSYRQGEEKDDDAWVARNIGWGLALRSSFDLARVALILEEGEAQGEWPERIDRALVWREFGFALGRAQPGLPARADALPARLTPEQVQEVVAGMKEGRSFGHAPRAPIPPPAPSARGTAT